eukprot:scaffold11233_cov59-Phaeocystis_antarctica.AAC.2
MRPSAGVDQEDSLDQVDAGRSRAGPRLTGAPSWRDVVLVVKHPPVSGGKRPLCTLGVPPGRSRGIGGCARAPCVFLGPPRRGGGRGVRARPGAGRKTCFVT